MRLPRLPRLPKLAALRNVPLPPLPALAGGVCGLAVLTLLAGFAPSGFLGRWGEELRLPIGLSVPETLLFSTDKRPLDTTLWMVRRPINGQPSSHHEASPDQDAGAFVAFSTDGVSILTAEGPRRVRPNPAGGLEGSGGTEDLFQLLSRQTLGLPSGLSLTATTLVSGRPAALCVAPPGSESARIAQVRRAWLAGGASPYSALVDAHAGRFNLDRSLVYAIMYTESGFNPTLISNRDAHGLMQIVPGGAGGEVHRYLHGAPGGPNTAALLDPATNIQYGVTYLHLLMQRHMGGVKDPLSREYCVIASYNIGPNAVLKVFGGPDRDAAFAAINAMTPMELYSALMERLPAAETRAFLRKVTLLRSGLALAD